uniref:Uncharacterized protein n=1 Tax=Anguilla anguilla TaxID=7936 RepID=A0A0E9WLG1_ANGAN
MSDIWVRGLSESLRTVGGHFGSVFYLLVLGEDGWNPGINHGVLHMHAQGRFRKQPPNCCVLKICTKPTAYLFGVYFLVRNGQCEKKYPLYYFVMVLRKCRKTSRPCSEKAPPLPV